MKPDFVLGPQKAWGLQSQGGKGAAVVELLQALDNTGSGALRPFEDGLFRSGLRPQYLSDYKVF